MTDQDQDQNHDQAGRAAVRALLIERLQGAGLRRARGISQTQHLAALDRLTGHLAYMTFANLETLAEVVLDAAQGGICPSEALIRQYGEALQARPLAQHRIVTSWLASVEGPRAEARGDLVELFRWLRRHAPRPPLPMDMRMIAEMAAANNRQRELIRGRIERQTASDEDSAWLAAYLRDQDAARQIVAGRHAADQAGQGDAA